MKLQHNSSGESSEDLIALIIAVQRRKEKGGERRRRKQQRKRVEEQVGEPDVAGVIQVFFHLLAPRRQHIPACTARATEG